MTTTGYYARGVLYFACAVLPIIETGMATHAPVSLTVISALSAGLLSIRAFIDKSPAEHADAQAMKAAEDEA